MIWFILILIYIITLILNALFIPYNNETKHLHKTSEMPPEKYITWEE